jgi:hypothetical protein
VLLELLITHHHLHISKLALKKSGKVKVVIIFSPSLPVITTAAMNQIKMIIQQLFPHSLPPEF